ncbi:hypothetical protein LCGC14_0719650 [marine sediment metagenome]|uniref:Uncharacterized protein n=2 Tax=root TaxID=1 RepID=A0A831QLZ8_9FLAO|nr:hypothetical protein [Pricia antarctica]
MEKIPYLGVGTAYYKSVHVPIIAGHFNELLVHCNIETIRQDHGKDLAKLPKYDSLIRIPSHIDYRQEYKGFYYTFFPLTAGPMERRIDISLTVVRCRGKGKRTLEKIASRHKIT